MSRHASHKRPRARHGHATDLPRTCHRPNPTMGSLTSGFFLRRLSARRFPVDADLVAHHWILQVHEHWRYARAFYRTYRSSILSLMYTIMVSLSTRRSEFATMSAATPTACILGPPVSHLFSIHLRCRAASFRPPLTLCRPPLPHSKPQPGAHMAHFGPMRTTPVNRNPAAIAMTTRYHRYHYGSINRSTILVVRLAFPQQRNYDCRCISSSHAKCFVDRRMGCMKTITTPRGVE